jgi:hypothetical protein
MDITLLNYLCMILSQMFNIDVNLLIFVNNLAYRNIAVNLEIYNDLFCFVLSSAAMFTSPYIYTFAIKPYINYYQGSKSFNVLKIILCVH